MACNTQCSTWNIGNIKARFLWNCVFYPATESAITEAHPISVVLCSVSESFTRLFHVEHFSLDNVESLPSASCLSLTCCVSPPIS